MFYLNLFFFIFLFVTLNNLVTSNQELSKYLNNQCLFNDGNFTGIYKPITYECSTLPTNIYPNKTIETINGQEITYFCCPDLRVSEQFCNANTYKIIRRNPWRPNIVIEGKVSNTAALFKQFIGKPGTSYNYEYICGGSIISEWYILTAAHCLPKSYNYNYFVIIGKHSIQDIRDWDVIPVKNIYQHDDYNNVSRQHDIALIKMEKRIMFTHLIVTPICLHSFNMNNGILDNEQIELYGWVPLDFYSNGMVIVAHQASVAIVNHTYCKRFHSNLVNESEFCTLDPNTGFLTTISTCEGDASIVVNNHSVLVGIMAHESSGGCRSVVPNVYTRVLSYIDWIEKIVWLS